MQTGHDYDFYRCQRCYRLLTQLEVVAGLQVRQGRLCPCGAMKISPVNLQLRDMVLPRVWAFAWIRFREIGWAGMKREIRADLVRWLLAGQGPPQRWVTCEVGTATDGPLILAESVSLARALVNAVRMPTGQELHITGPVMPDSLSPAAGVSPVVQGASAAAGVH
jgi:hypothetical protein